MTAGICALLSIFAPALLATAHAATGSTQERQVTEQYRSGETRSTRFASAGDRLTSDELDRTRGGFSTPGGFDFSIGLTNIRRVNDEPLVTQQLFSVTDVISGLTQSGMGHLVGGAAVPDQPVVLQLGAGNQIARGVLAQRAGIPKTIIQNSLDNQHIRNTNVYDFKLDNVGALTRTLNRNARRAALSQRLVDSIR